MYLYITISKYLSFTAFLQRYTSNIRNKFINSWKVFGMFFFVLKMSLPLLLYLPYAVVHIATPNLISFYYSYFLVHVLECIRVIR